MPSYSPSNTVLLIDPVTGNAANVDVSGNLKAAIASLPALPAGANSIGSVTPTPNADTAALITHTAAAVGASGADQTNASGRGVQIGVNITAITGTTPTLTVIVEGKDAASGAYYTLLSSAALSATGFTLLTVYPGVTAAANVAANQALPRTWRVRTVIGGTTPAVTATVGASVVS